MSFRKIKHEPHVVKTEVKIIEFDVSQSTQSEDPPNKDSVVGTLFGEAIVTDEIVKEEPVFFDPTQNLLGVEMPPSQLQIIQSSDLGKIVKQAGKSSLNAKRKPIKRENTNST